VIEKSGCKGTVIYLIKKKFLVQLLYPAMAKEICHNDTKTQKEF